MEKVTITKEVYKDVCPFCHKVLISEYEEQFKYNYDAHYKACEKKKEIVDGAKEV